MTSGEWGLFMAELRGSFRGEVDEAREAALRQHVGRVPAAEATRALRRLVDCGEVFVPTPAEVKRALRSVARGEWEYRRLLAGRSAEEQRAEDARIANGMRRLTA